MRIYKQQRKTSSNPPDSLRDTFSHKEIDFLCTYNQNSPLYKLEANRNDYLWEWHSNTSRISRNTEWIEFSRIDDFIVTMYRLLNGNQLNLNDKDSKFLIKLVDKIATIRYRRILSTKYDDYLDNRCI